VNPLLVRQLERALEAAGANYNENGNSRAASPRISEGCSASRKMLRHAQAPQKGIGDLSSCKIASA